MTVRVEDATLLVGDRMAAMAADAFDHATALLNDLREADPVVVGVGEM